jgi:exodeoxyribonuclease-3
VRIPTYNVNGINGRLANLLAWLRDTAPDIACLQELKAPDGKFPASAIRNAGYGAVWHGQKAWNGVAILQRAGEPALIRRGLPGDPDDTHSRYIEAAVNGLIVGCLYLPNGNPAPGPKFDYKLCWFERLQEHAGGLLASGAPVVLAGDYNVMPTELDDCAQDQYFGRCETAHLRACSIGPYGASVARNRRTVGNASVRSRQAEKTG